MAKPEFQHKQAAHCENGVTSNLLRFYGIDLSEPMVFGMGSGYFFSHMPFIKLHGMPVTSFRVWPGFIFKRVTDRLGIDIERLKYSNRDKAMDDLDALLEKGIPVGMLVGVFHLPYFPREYRFHFNAHNITVIGRENGRYIISDPVMEHEEFLTRDELKKVRFARGTHAPEGRMYYIKEIPGKFDMLKAVKLGIDKTSRDMLKIPLPMFGINGIRYLSKRMRRWPDRMPPDEAALNLSQVIRMLEEIGTGGAGFRFMFAAFLQESGALFEIKKLDELSREMTAAGDMWREFAWNAARLFKNRDRDGVTYDTLADRLLNIADKEEYVFRQLHDIRL